MIVVLDTNVIVSGILKPDGPPGQVLDLLVTGQITAAYDDRLLMEYNDVLTRPKLALNPERVQTFLDVIRLAGIAVADPPPLTIAEAHIPDKDDVPFAEVALAASANALITGNRRHFEFLTGQLMQVFAPAEFLDYLASLSNAPQP